MQEDPQKRLKEFHGKTVVVETRQGQTFIGRCSRFENDNLILVDLDHRHGDWVANAGLLDAAVKQGHWPVIKKAFVPKAEITRMELLIKAPWREPSQVT
jgi:small nuclear ribonucleoprotein (snRNP)-like protein